MTIKFGDEVLTDLRTFYIPALDTVVMVSEDDFPSWPSEWIQRVEEPEINKSFYIQAWEKHYGDGGEELWRQSKLFGHHRHFQAIMEMLNEPGHREASVAVFPAQWEEVLVWLDAGGYS